MLRRVLYLLYKKFNHGSSPALQGRTANTLIHVFLNVVFKAGAILCSFLLVPISLHYLNEDNYGVWLTLNSVVSWLTFFDAGLGNGLKNKLAETFALGDTKSARAYVSTTYILLAAILLGLLALYSISTPFIDWNKILNTTSISSAELDKVAYISVLFFCARLVFDLIFSVLAADQKTGYTSMITFIATLITLLAVYIISKTTQPSLMYMALALSGIPVVISLISNIYLFIGRYRNIRPTHKAVNLNIGKNVLNLGFRFFAIQLALLVIYSANNVVINQLYGAKAVTHYNIVYKYFSAINILWSILLVPYWTALGDAYFKKDFLWIEATMKMLNKFWFALSGLLVCMLIISPWAYRIWLGEDLNIPPTLSVVMAIFVLVTTFSNLYVMLINGTGKIQLQFYMCIVIAIITIPLSLFFAEILGLGLTGIVIGNCVSLLLGPVINYIQYKKILSSSDTGIWGK
jgi:O-antigen/teichoic acid export membrane protein